MIKAFIYWQLNSNENLALEKRDFIMRMQNNNWKTR